MKIVNINDIAWMAQGTEQFESHRKPIAQHTDAKELGMSLYKLMPSKKAFPFHSHHNNEEAIIIIEGSGTLRGSDSSFDVKKGDYISLPKGKDNAHQMINTSDEALIYLCISTMNSPDVIEYPDSKKIGIMTGSAPGQSKKENSEKLFYYKSNDVSYFDGEK